VRNENVSAEFVFGQEDLSSMFHLPLLHAAFDELGQLQQLLHDNPLSSQEDSWTYCWGERYTSAKFYTHIHAHIVVPRVYKWLWKSSCIMRTKTFA
jgi:hypothetical protein